MPYHRNRHLMLPHQMQIALRFAPVVAEQAPPGPGNGETACADFTSRMQPLKARLHGSVRMTLLASGDLFSLSHYEYGEAYYGSLSGMRFRVAREPLVNVSHVPADQRGEAVFRVVAWPEPNSYRTAPNAAKTARDFPFSQEGLDEIISWLNEIHRNRFT